MSERDREPMAKPESPRPPLQRQEDIQENAIGEYRESGDHRNKHHSTILNAGDTSPWTTQTSTVFGNSLNGTKFGADDPREDL